MRSDRYRNFVLTVIAIALFTLALPRLEMREVMAESGQPEAVMAGSPQQRTTPPTEVIDAVAQGSRAPTSTLPLRWRVSWAALETGNYDTWCSTVIAVTNTTTSDVDVEVEWIDSIGTSLALRPMTVSGHFLRAWIPGRAVNNAPFYVQDFPDPDLADFKGYALVTADDPRIMVSAFQFCRTGLGISGPTVVSQTHIPAYPVGATAEYFQAGMPAGWTAPTVVPE